MASQPVEIGQKIPLFQLDTIDGRSLDVSEFSGKRLIVFCWASW